MTKEEVIIILEDILEDVKRERIHNEHYEFEEMLPPHLLIYEVGLKEAIALLKDQTPIDPKYNHERKPL